MKDLICEAGCVYVASDAAGIPCATHSASTFALSGLLALRNELLAADEHGSVAAGKFSCTGRNSSEMFGARIERLYPPRSFTEWIGFHSSVALYVFAPPARLYSEWR